MAVSKEAIKRARDKYRASVKGKLKEKEYNAKWYRENKEHKRILDRLRKYDLTFHEYDTLLKRQDGSCALCNRPPKTKKTHNSIDGFVIDHCHITGAVRGLLCSTCNLAIGLLEDSPDLVLKAYEYLQKSMKGAA